MVHSSCGEVIVTWQAPWRPQAASDIQDRELAKVNRLQQSLHQALRNGQTKHALQYAAAILALRVTPLSLPSCAAAQHDQKYEPCLGAVTLVHRHTA